MKATLHSYRLLILLGLSVLVVSGLGAGWLLSQSGEDKTSAAGDSISPPKAASKESTVVCFGQVDIERGCTPLSPVLPGRVSEVNVKEGDTVKAGQVLLKLDDGQARVRVEEAKAALNAAEALLEKARSLPRQLAYNIKMQEDAVNAAASRIAAARLALEHKQELRKSKLIPPSELSIAEESIKEAEALHAIEKNKLEHLKLQDTQSDVKRAEAEVAVARARLQQADDAVEECLLKAPRNGTVARIQTTVGDVLGTPGRSPALIFAADDPRIIRAEVEQEFAAQVAAGQKVRVQDDVNSKVVFEGKVDRVSDWFLQRRTVFLEPTRYNDARTVECVITLDQGHPALRIGQRVRVTINPPE